MKKFIAVFAILLMLLSMAACGGAPAEETPQVTPETTAEEMTVDMAEGPLTAYYEYNSANMLLSLPAGWEFALVGGSYDDGEAHADPADSFGIEFWPVEDPELRLSLLYYMNGLGMCGTGVTIEDVSYANGLSGWKYTEAYKDSGKTMLTIIFKGLAGTYALNGYVPNQLLEKYEATIDGILDSAVLAAGCLTEEEAIALADQVRSVDYDRVRADYDFICGEWRICFYTSNMAGGDQTVWLDTAREVVKIEYGE